MRYKSVKVALILLNIMLLFAFNHTLSVCFYDGGPVFPQSYLMASADEPDIEILYCSINETGGNSVLYSWLSVNSTSYNFTVYASHKLGRENIADINITGWYDWGNESTVYNQTKGGNVNFFLSYNNSLGTFELVFPKTGEILFEGGSVYNKSSDISVVNFTIKPMDQFYGANGSGKPGPYENPYSWNFLVNVSDDTDKVSFSGEFGVMFATSIYISDVSPYASLGIPGETVSTMVFTIRESSNRPYYLNITIFDNLTHTFYSFLTISMENIYITAASSDGSDNNDNLFYNVTENDGNTFSWDSNVRSLKNTGVQYNGTSQHLDDIRFRIFIPPATMGGTYNTYFSFRLQQKRPGEE